MIGYSIIDDDGKLLQLPKSCTQCKSTKPKWEQWSWRGWKLDEQAEFNGEVVYRCGRCGWNLLLEGKWVLVLAAI
jgi:hypothetical protein